MSTHKSSIQEFSTPMMKQYAEIKKQYADCLLFYRMGDFYELFMEDAHIGAQVLNITLTSRPKGKDGRIPMAGVPYHAVDSYLAKLVKAGYKVAICEQVSLPNKHGIVDREVIRIVTPGTVLDEKALEKNENNYIVSLDVDQSLLALSFADLSTGYFGTYELSFTDLAQTLRDELSKLSPTECILREELYNDPEFLRLLRHENGLNIYPFTEWNNFAQDAEKILKRHFNVATLAPFDIDHDFLSQKTAAALLGYLEHTQKSPVTHIKKLIKLTNSDHLIMDRSTMINLELFSTIRDHDPKGSLLYVLDHTLTPMGGRLLKSWIKKPLANKTQIERRYDAVSEVLENLSFRGGVENLLKEIPDIERTLSRLSVQIGNARDCVNLKQAMITVLAIREALENAESQLLKDLHASISPQLSQVVSIIETQIVPEPPIDLKEGGLIRHGVNAELDKLRQTVSGSRNWILELEAQERKKTGILSLKIRFNKVFGFYIEVSKANLHLVPSYYMRKQTLVNGERFITPDLKHHEEIILTAEERIKNLEYELFQEILKQVLSFTDLIQQAAESIGMLDCVVNFASVSLKNQYVKPLLSNSDEIHITNGRHPVVEELLEETPFVPNDTVLNTTQQMMLITGPNMAGKSVYIRQVALIVLMAQIGCFVPAEKADISIVDRIFVRSGASDVITSGLSTFMVEMVETAYILRHATKNSLIVMDEIGRGTSTYDGISIAWAVAEYLVSNFRIAPKTLFATHYHELQALEEKYPRQIHNFHMSVTDNKGTPIFLHTILPGGASHSFGVAVARLAGVPEEVVRNAQKMLESLEKSKRSEIKTTVSSLPKRKAPKNNPLYTPSQTPYNLIDKLIHKELEHLDISRMTPLEALNKLAEMKEKLDVYEAETKQINEAD